MLTQGTLQNDLTASGKSMATDHFEERLRQYSNRAHNPDKSDEANFPTVLAETVSGKYIELERQA